MLSGSFGAGGLADFFTICRITLVLFESFFFPLSLIGFSPPGSGVVGLVLRGLSGSETCLSIGRKDGLIRSTVFLAFTLIEEEDSIIGAKRYFTD